jgi:hypothetical protein
MAGVAVVGVYQLATREYHVLIVYMCHQEKDLLLLEQICPVYLAVYQQM